MIPHERSLVNRLEGKPFVLIGVNSDPDPAEIPRQIRESQVSWRSFKNRQGEDKNLAADWLITSWPTLILIDHRGVIRQRWEGAPDPKVLDREINKLLS